MHRNSSQFKADSIETIKAAVTLHRAQIQIGARPSAPHGNRGGFCGRQGGFRGHDHVDRYREFVGRGFNSNYEQFAGQGNRPGNDSSLGNMATDV